MKINNLIFICVIASFLSITLVSAVSVSITANQSAFSLSPGQNAAVNISYFIDNQGAAGGSYGVSLSGQFISTSTTTVSFPTNGSVTGSFLVQIAVPSNTQQNTYTSTITFGGETETLSFTISPSSQIIVFPTNKVISLQQGVEETQNVFITVPSTYPRPVTIQSVDFNPGTPPIKFGNLNLGQVSPGQTISLPIIFTAKTAQTGSYGTGLNFFAIDSLGQVPMPTVSLTLQVTSGITPITNETFSSPPQCSLSATTFSLNGTYMFTCQNVNNNLEVNVEYNPFIEGLSASRSGNFYTYTFKAKKVGVTQFVAKYSYQGSSLFTPFSQEIRIGSVGSAGTGNILKVVFTPNIQIAKPNEKVIMQIVDTQSNSLVQEPEIYINAMPQEKIGLSFNYSFLPTVNYSIRARSPGYDDLVFTVLLESKQLNLSIVPPAGTSSTYFNISEPNNATIFVDDTKVTNPFYSTLAPGVRTIKAIKEGFEDQIVNLTVESSVTAILQTPEFKKGSPQIILLTKSSNWTVFYKENDAATEQEIVTNGTGVNVEFTPKKKGVYVVESDGKPAGTFQIQKGDGMLWGLKWYWWLAIVVVVVILIIVINSGTSSSSEEIAYGGHLNR